MCAQDLHSVLVALLLFLMWTTLTIVIAVIAIIIHLLLPHPALIGDSSQGNKKSYFSTQLNNKSILPKNRE
jgi:hypothetical protein